MISKEQAMLLATCQARKDFPAHTLVPLVHTLQENQCWYVSLRPYNERETLDVLYAVSPLSSRSWTAHLLLSIPHAQLGVEGGTLILYQLRRIYQQRMRAKKRLIDRQPALLFYHEMKEGLWYLPKLYILRSFNPDDIFYVGMTATTAAERLRHHLHEAYDYTNASYYSPKNERIRFEDGIIQMQILFYVRSSIEWYELACIEILNERYELTNIRAQIHKYLLYGGQERYDEIVEETREKLQAFFALPDE